jgi:hypothetical protein
MLNGLAFARLLACSGVIVVHGVLVRRPGVAFLTRRRGDLTPETQYSEEEEPKPVRAFAQLRRLGFGLMTVSHGNPSWSVPHTAAHAKDELASEPLGVNTRLPHIAGHGRG